MLPQINDGLIADFEIEENEPSITYKLDLNKKRISGLIDGRDAIEQAIYKVIDTPRYEHIIYTWNYGSEHNTLFGQPAELAYSELKRYLTEALLQDNRIKNVDSFTFIKKGKRVSLGFRVETVVGVIDVTKEVMI